MGVRDSPGRPGPGAGHRHRQRGRALQRLHDRPGRGPASAQVTHFHYNKPLPHKGGTDAISVYHCRVLISASAPGTTGKAAPQPTYPAVYSVTFHRATVREVNGTGVFSAPAKTGGPKEKVKKDAVTVR